MYFLEMQLDRTILIAVVLAVFVTIGTVYYVVFLREPAEVESSESLAMLEGLSGERILFARRSVPQDSELEIRPLQSLTSLGLRA